MRHGFFPGQISKASCILEGASLHGAFDTQRIADSESIVLFQWTNASVPCSRGRTVSPASTSSV